MLKKKNIIEAIAKIYMKIRILTVNQATKVVNILEKIINAVKIIIWDLEKFSNLNSLFVRSIKNNTPQKIKILNKNVFSLNTK